MKSRYLGIIFVAAVIVPSILLAVLSIRAAGREEAYVEKQLATPLLAEATHAAALAADEVATVAEELRRSIVIPSKGDYARILSDWKRGTALVGVPFLLSPRYRILWPKPAGNTDEAGLQFLQENADFLSDRAATPVFQNIAVAYRDEILAEAESAPAAGSAEASAAAPAVSEKAGAARSAPAASDALASQRALDAYAQSETIQALVREEAKEKGDALNTRVVQPTAAAGGAPAAPAAKTETVADAKAFSAPEPPQQQAQSQYVITSRLLSQIAAGGDHGIIPRFVGESLAFLFWSRQADGRIAGCQIATAAFRDRIAAVLPSTVSAVRLVTILDENGQPLVVPPGSSGRDWRRPFVSWEIGETLPRWEVASYLASPDSISSRARSSSLTIWILVLILFVSVAGGGTMVLTSVYGEIRLAQKKATFVTNVSHELKTPLTSISMFVEMLRQKRQPDPEKRERYLALVASETERLTRLINNVLDFSAGDRGGRKYARRRLDAAAVVRGILEGQRVRLEARGFTVRFDGAGADPPLEVVADEEALKQVVLNLLSNAEKYSPARKEIEVQLAREGDFVAVHVRDRGVGVQEKDRERIFREFFRVDDSLASGVQGTGLGLTIARRIARDHGGDVAHAPREGGGSDFSLSLPAAPPGGET